MIIQTIEISNFRGVKGTKQFVFDGKPFVLLSAPNGLGKTTLIDAIEWCFTGNIGRLKVAFDSRSTNNDERKKNINGILKNKNAKSTDEICVNLQISDESKKYLIKRTQKKDELNEKLSTLWINGKKDASKSFLNEFIDSNFYNFHFCDVQKSLGMQSRKRKDLPELFSDFISDYTKEITIASNLELFIEDIDRYKEDLNNEKISDNEINIKKELCEKYANVSVNKKYPSIQIYQAENIEITSLDEKGLKQQLQKLNECGYKQVERILEEIVFDTETREVISKLERLNNILVEKKKQIEEAVRQELHKGEEKIINYGRRIQQNTEIELTEKNIWEYTPKLIAFEHSNFTEEECNNAKKAINEVEKTLNDLQTEIETLVKGNEILDLFSSLVTHKCDLVEYRTENIQEMGIAKCPICGSSQFGQINEEEILKEATEYTERHSTLLTQKKTVQSQLREQLNLLYDNLLKTCNQVLQDAIQRDKKAREQLILLQNETKEFVELISKLANVDSDKYAVEKLLSEGYVDNILKQLEEGLFTKDIILQKQKEYKKILELLEYQMQENETEKSTVQRVKEMAQDAPEVINFNHSLLVQKINSINSFISNQEYLRAKKEWDDSIKKNENIDKQKKELDELQEKAIRKTDSIRSLVNKLKDDEYNSVGSNLYKFYKKLSRINTIEEIQIKPDDENLSLEDESGRTVVNILSNGQLSVFMLAYFFAGIVSRSKNERCKIYFIDDLTACMDDVNMLAFLDLMKYQLLAENGTIEQLFFASCDERICKLLRYKLDGCGIDYCELREKEFA